MVGTVVRGVPSTSERLLVYIFGFAKGSDSASNYISWSKTFNTFSFFIITLINLPLPSIKCKLRLSYSDEPENYLSQAQHSIE